MTADTYRVRSFAGVLHHQYVDTNPSQKHGMIEETWRLGPFEYFHTYVRDDRKYGSRMLSLSLALRRWKGPWLNISFGGGCQDWDRDEQWWKS